MDKDKEEGETYKYYIYAVRHLNSRNMSDNLFI